MKRTNRILLTVVLLVFACTNIFAYDCEVNGIYYNRISVDEFEVTSGTNKYTGDIVIPETVEYEGVTYNVTSIGEWAFYYCSGLTSVTIPNCVTSIGHYAFRDCKILTSIVIPASVNTIGEGAFFKCGPQTTLSIPNSVTTIGDCAFAGTNVETLYFHKTACDNIGQWLDAPNEQRATIQKIVFGKEVTTISFNFFGVFSEHIEVEEGNSIYDSREGCNAVIETQTNTLVAASQNSFIPNTVENIGRAAFFYNSNLTTVTIPSSVKTIGLNAFWGCNSLIKVIVERKIPIAIEEYVFSNCANATLYVPVGSKTAYAASKYWKDFKEIVEITPSPAIAFTDAEVKTLCVANWDTDGDGELSEEEAAAVTDLGKVFMENTAITSFPELSYFSGLTSISSEAFSGCINLTSVSIPDNVKDIGINAFRECRSLTSIKIPNGVTTIAVSTFAGCRSLTSVDIPDGVTAIDIFAFQNCSSLTSLTIPNSVTTIANEAFSFCSGLTSVTIPSSVTSLGIAFTYCSGLTSISVDEGNPKYDSRGNCNAIIETASNTLIQGCKNTVIPNNITVIGECAFIGCSDLTSITIPSGVTSIADYAFNGCSNLTSVTVEMKEPVSLYSHTFSNNTEATLYVPAGSKAAYEAADVWKMFKNIVELIVFADAEVKALCVANWDTDGDGELSEAEAAAVTKLGTVFKDNEKIKSFNELKYFTGLNKIDAEAFQGCTNLKTIEVPAVVTGIGSGAFLNCKSLLSIEIPASVKTLGYQAFCNCTSLTSFTVPANVTYIGERIFVGCSSLASLKVEEGNAVYDSRNDCNAIIKTESNELLAASLNTVIPEGIKKIYDSVFSGRKDLIHVELPEGLETLEDWVFSGCTNLQSLSFPSTMKDYGEYTISGVSTLRQLIINARKAPDNRFQYFFWGVPDEFDIYKFTWYVPKGTRETYVKSIPWWSGKARGIIESGEDTEVITFADEEVQRLCIEKYDANYSGTVDMEEAAGVLEVTNTYFSNKVFNGNTQIKSFDEFQYFTGIEKLDASAFSGCSSLVSITLPENLTSIGSFAFGSCRSLPSIIIPQNVSTIGSSAFSGCDNMKSVTMMNSTPVTIGQYADPFPLRKMITLRVPKGSKAAYEAADYWREFKDIVEIGDAGLAGDANGDGVVDVADVVAIVNYILNKPGENFNEKAADVNGDGVIDVADVVAVVNIILKGGN